MTAHIDASPLLCSFEHLLKPQIVAKGIEVAVGGGETDQCLTALRQCGFEQIERLVLLRAYETKTCEIESVRSGNRTWPMNEISTEAR